VVGCFHTDTSEKKTKKKQVATSEPALAPPKPMLIARAPIRVGMGLSNPPFRGRLRESSDGWGYPQCPRSELRLSSIINDSLTIAVESCNEKKKNQN
jgi:hypothetical protein